MRTVKSKPGMTQVAALLSLQKHARASNEEIVSFVLEGNRWSADLRHIAEFPPTEKDSPPAEDAGPPTPDDEAPEDDAPEGDGGPPKVPGSEDQGPEGEKGEEKGEIKHILSLITQIADKLGIVPEGHEEKLGDGGPVPPPLPGPGAPPSGLGSAGKDGPLPTKLHPGEVLPHQTPVGAPAFASRQAMLPGDPIPGAAAAPVSAPCSKCGGPTQGGVCPTCSSPSPAGVQASITDPHQQLGKKRTISAVVDTPMTEVEAYSQATAAFKPSGYAVQQLLPQANGTWVAVLQG